MREAARLARALGLKRISAVEFGVAGGNGLVAMEDYATRIRNELGVEYQIYGFDLETGLPDPKDYRDLPYTWKKGFFKMDRAALEARLKVSQLIIGDVADTLKSFVPKFDPAPVGFCAFDMDLYTSTKSALQLLESPCTRILPRTYLYFDDIIGDHNEIHCEYVGELLSIKEFNFVNAMRKIAKINGLSCKMGKLEVWHESVFVLHAFDHPAYVTYTRGVDEWKLPLNP
jgi:hypothetical protein